MKKGSRFKPKKPIRRQAAKETGQSATEAIMFLGVVLIIAITSVSLIGDGLGKSSGISESSSKILWSRQSPVSVTEWSVGDGKLGIAVENKGSYPVRVTSLLGGEESVPMDSAWIQPGEKAVLPQVNYQSLNPSSGCGEYGSAPGTLSINNFGFAYEQSVGTGGTAAIISQIQQVNAPLSIGCHATDPHSGGSAACGTCAPSESCCTAPSNPLQYYCYDSSRPYLCSSDVPCEELGWDLNMWAGCPDVCPGGCNPQLGACCISTNVCMAAGSPCTERPFLICYGDLGEWVRQKCCVDTHSMVDGTAPCNTIACGGATCDGNSQACCSEGGGSAFCMDNGGTCRVFGEPLIACGGAFCRTPQEECCLATHSCVLVGFCK
ncbi:MAG: hypothetical protein WC588_02205 [Candidatus Micrarchaeia archaeon]